MQYINQIKTILGLVLIIFGLYIGFKIMSEVNEIFIIKTSVAVGGSSQPITATLTPIYAGMCLFAGAYLLNSTKN